MTPETTLDLNDDTIAALQDLVRVNVDSAKGLLVAAEAVNSEAIANVLRDISRQRELFAEEFAAVLSMNDVDANDWGSITGVFHRWWIGFRGSVSSGDEYSMLAEARVTEEEVVRRYRLVLEQIGDNPTRSAIERHFEAVLTGSEALRVLLAARA